MTRSNHLLGVAVAVAVLVGVTSLVSNDYYLRIVFMMCVYYLLSLIHI